MKPLSEIYEGVLFDVDGTLVDSNKIHARVWSQALAIYGRHIDADEIRPHIGKGADKLLPDAVGIDASSDEGKAVEGTRHSLLVGTALDLIHPFRGARQLLQRLKRAGVALGVASSAKPRELRAVLERANLQDLLPHEPLKIASSKPDPDVLLASLDRMRLPASSVVFVGDTPYDVEAGARAGIRVIGVLSGGFSKKALRGAIAIYESVGELLKHFDESPFASSEHIPSFARAAR